MHPFVKEVLERTAHLWDEMVYMDSDTGQDITTPDQRKAYESGLLRMREAMIPIAIAPLNALLTACDKALLCVQNGDCAEAGWHLHDAIIRVRDMDEERVTT